MRATFDAAIRHHLSQLIESLSIRSIACFSPFDGEPDIMPLCRQLLTRNYTMALPVVSGNGDHTMEFHAWRTDTELATNGYGIDEPQATERLALSDFALLTMPLVGYDLQGNRLGMGSGYYDRHLEPLRDSDTPLRVGVAYGMQEVGVIAAHPWDIPLHGIVNERGWFTFVK